MGTRADFYVGKGKKSEWIGSIAWDGYPQGISGYVLKAKSDEIYRRAVKTFSRSGMMFPCPNMASRGRGPIRQPPITPTRSQMARCGCRYSGANG
jgi:hypothetical protein